LGAAEDAGEIEGGLFEVAEVITVEEVGMAQTPAGEAATEEFRGTLRGL
jgi:hypothetical protein